MKRRLTGLATVVSLFVALVLALFALAEVGAKSATFNVNSNDPDEPDVTFYVSGNGTEPAIYYVSPTGDDSTGDGSEGTPWRTITKAKAMASDGDIIKVMDDDELYTVDYTGNFDVNKQLTIERYNDVGPNPLINGGHGDHVFHVSASNVVIRGLDIEGASGDYMSGIYLDGVDHCTIQNNYCGSYNYFWPNGCGIRLSNSSFNTISDNICEFNMGDRVCFGIYLSGSSNNILIGNTANDNKAQRSHLDPGAASAYGIFISNSDFNTVVGNTANSNRADGYHGPGYAYGIIVSGSTGNTISGNTANDNHGYATFWPGGCGYGIYVASSTDNTISDNTANSNFGVGDGLIGWDTYLWESTNNIINNNTINYIGLYDSSNDNDIYLNNFGAIDSDSTNDWSSSTPLCYKYASTPHRSYMGNYYYYHAGADTDNDGICDDPYYYTTDNGDDQNPLWQTSDSYSLFAWWLGNPWTMYKGDMNKGPGTVTIPAGGSVTWIADEVALTNVAFPASQGWTGQLVFTSAPEIGDDFTVEIGSSDGGFAPGGPQATLTGDGSATTFTYTTNNASFTVQGGHYLALRITIGSAASYDVRTGGAWSYTSAPDLSCPLYPPIPPGRDIRTPIDIDFGDVPVGSSRDETTTIYNDGDGTTSLTVNNITRISGSDEFTYVGPETSFGISGGAGRIVTIRFAPNSAGAKSATFNVNSNDPDEPDVTFDVSGNGESTVEIQLSLQAGWNMVSLPVMPADNSTSAVFPEVAGVFTWNATDRSYYEPTVIDPEKGYWVAVTENTTISINGTPVETWTTDIKAGWNMIGSVSANASIDDPNDDPDGSVIPPAYWWDPVDRKYIETTDIEPGKGYWIASLNDCALTL